MDNVALDAAVDRGVYVTNVPDYCVEEVAVHAFALLLTLARGVLVYDSSVAAGEWDRDAASPLRRLSTRTVGLVGLGDIGRALARRVDAFDVDVLFSDPYLTKEDVVSEPVSLTTFETLLTEADYISIHAPLTDDTRGLFDQEAFARMKPTSALINVSRGPIVDEDALVTALDDGEIEAAGLDLFEPEPPQADSPLRDHSKVVTTPHVAWYSEEANAERRRRAAECVRAALVGDEPDHIVVDPHDSS